MVNTKITQTVPIPALPQIAFSAATLENITEGAENYKAHMAALKAVRACCLIFCNHSELKDMDYKDRRKLNGVLDKIERTLTICRRWHKDKSTWNLYNAVKESNCRDMALLQIAFDMATYHQYKIMGCTVEFNEIIAMLSLQKWFYCIMENVCQDKNLLN